jgi:hypothetical protein
MPNFKIALMKILIAEVIGGDPFSWEAAMTRRPRQEFRSELRREIL